MKNWKLFLVASILFSACNKEQQVDLIIHNASIYTLNETLPKAEAIAIKSGKIIAIGTENEILNKYSASQKIDVQKKPIFPGFIDAHCHFLGYGLYSNVLNLKGTTSFKNVLEKINEYAKTNTSDWIIGRGWDQNDWQEKNFPNKEELDSLFPNTPVYLKRVDGHAALLNTKALQLAGINTKTKIDGGEIFIENNKLTGIITDNAMNLVEQALPSKKTDEKKNALLLAQQNCFAVGLTTVDDAGLDYEDVLLIQKLHNNGTLKMKIYAMLNPTKENEKLAANGIIKTNRLTVRSFKLYADGSLGSRGALLKQPYNDKHNHIGVIVDSLEKINHFAQLCYSLNFQLNTHSIGDSANAMMLSVYGNYLKTTNDLRWRIEHAQVVDKSDLNYFSQYTIIPSVQPTHATSDMYWAEKRLGTNRVHNAYAYSDLLKQNGIIALGTDFPVEDINPIYTFYAAVARKDHSNFPLSGFQKENALSRENALKGITIWAAIANFEENEKGSLEVGKDADFVVLDRDIMKVKEEFILDTKVVYTFVAGEKVFGK
jgi:predicted amidohydrolase YtcJ